MTKLSPHVTCEHGEIELFCDPCDQLAYHRRAVTAWSRSDRDPGTRWLSARQERKLRDALRDLPEQLALAVAVMSGERLGDNDGGRFVPGSRPPLSIATLDLIRPAKPDVDPIAHDMGNIAPALATLESWVRLAHGEMLDTDTDTTDPSMHPTVATEAAWLLRHIVWVLEQQWVTELAEDVRRLSSSVRNALRERAEYQPRCPKCRDHVTQHSGYFECPSGHQTEARHLMALQHPMTADQLAEAFDVTTAAIRKWVERGHLEPAVGEDGKVLKSGKAHRYHVTDVLRLIDSGRKTA